MHLRTLVFFAGWSVLTLGVGIFAIPTLVSQRAVWKAAHFWASCTLVWLRVTCGITSKVRGRKYLKNAKIIAANHQSAWDTLMLWCMLKNPVFVLKRELFFIPIFGWYLWRTGQIGIDRANPKGAIEQIVDYMQKAQGRTLVIFPQGTRVKPDDHKPFKHGVGRISAALGWEVVPAALNAGYFWPKKPIWKAPGKAILEFLPPIPAPTSARVSPWVNTLEKQVMERARALYALNTSRP